MRINLCELDLIIGIIRVVTGMNFMFTIFYICLSRHNVVDVMKILNFHQKVFLTIFMFSHVDCAC